MPPPSSQPRLTLVLVASKPDKKDYYAIVPFPETYEVRILDYLSSWTTVDVTQQDAIEAATTSLGRYMTDREGKDIILRRHTVNVMGEWIWADIRPEHWSIVVERHPTAEVGIFLVAKEAPARVPIQFDTFLRGGLHFTYWIDDGRSTTTRWFPLPNLNAHPGSLPNSYIDRPESYTVSGCTSFPSSPSSLIHIHLDCDRTRYNQGQQSL